MRIPADYVEIRSEDGGMRVLTRLGEEPPQFQGGVGGWESVNRPGRRPLTVFRGIQDPLTLTLPLLFDRFTESANGRSVEAQCRILEKMGGLDRGDPEPPTLIVEGSLPHDESRAKSNLWVIDSLEWADSIRRRTDGHRVRQAVTVTLLLYTEDDALARLRRANKPKHRFVKAKAGETFEKIAARELKSGRLGNKLARLNGKKSGGQKLKAGTTVRLPSADALKTWRREG